MSGFSFKNPLPKRTFFILANLSEKEKEKFLNGKGWKEKNFITNKREDVNITSLMAAEALAGVGMLLGKKR